MTTTEFFEKPGSRLRRERITWDIVTVVLVVLLLALVVYRLQQKGQLESENWEVVYNPAVLKLFGLGLLATLGASCCAMAISLVLGLLFAAARLSRRLWLRILGRTGVELFRGLPVLILIFLIYLGLPLVGITISSFWSLVLGISLYNGALIAEIYRAGILSLPRGQSEAAESIGLTSRQAMQYVLLPQAIRSMLPALISQLVVVVKESSLGFVVGYIELLRDGDAAVNYLGIQYALPIFVEVSLIFIAVNLLLTRLAKWVERRSRHRVGIALSPALEAE